MPQPLRVTAACAAPRGGSTKITAAAAAAASGEDDGGAGGDAGGDGGVVAAPYVWLVVGDAGAYDVLLRMVYRAELSCTKVFFLTAIAQLARTPEFLHACTKMSRGSLAFGGETGPSAANGPPTSAPKLSKARTPSDGVSHKDLVSSPLQSNRRVRSRRCASRFPARAVA